MSTGPSRPLARFKVIKKLPTADNEMRNFTNAKIQPPQKEAQLLGKSPQCDLACFRLKGIAFAANVRRVQFKKCKAAPTLVAQRLNAKTRF
jgi:hypothetical protein